MNQLNRISLISPDDPNYQKFYKMYLEKRVPKDYFIGFPFKGIVCCPGCHMHMTDEQNVIFSHRLIDLISLGYKECDACSPLGNGNESQAVKGIIRNYANDIRHDAYLRESISALGESYALAEKWFQNQHHADLHQYLNMKRINALLEEENHLSTETDRIILYHRFWTPVGAMIGCFIDGKLCLLEFADRKELSTELLAIKSTIKGQFKQDDSMVSVQLYKELGEYFSGTRKKFSIPLASMGTDFQLKAWDLLLTIPYGKISTYKFQAELMGKSKAVRAVGRANSTNRIAILIPCHRVIGESGELTGYSGGLERKKYLLEMEASFSGEELSKIE
ncbi:methylated-DNA--[protein]-cysteine S-methyltransferase [Heyndrickxia acidicola]|uniref:Methylated-DNA--[protein]-cysteine S-methyltransferase n=1 Tax=Heyndrickxia acidicola TaxID=209389 RepID=A0ABU6MHE2_9BACI|nr:methylated-DNA--[protein]-cysteine S-methyltransferase [Heyndrickxia acidicola]MED1204101.1 methylated-DNA--[protein]-cysteine S-methyltransferase [Heyndrickxia acidicola]